MQLTVERRQAAGGFQALQVEAGSSAACFRSHHTFSYLIFHHQTGKQSSKIVYHLHTWLLSETLSAFVTFILPLV